ncbi:thioredoxin [Candidatus Peregrinibacteria bacterium]|nr:thioredoxin [Candidatus Peregrinibacteria bacterium]
MTKHFTESNFQTDVIEASKERPVLVDFFADWCGPCQMQAPVIDELSSEIGDKAFVGKLDTESSPNISMRYGVMSIPTLIIFRNGKEVDRASGVQSKEILTKVLELHK